MELCRDAGFAHFECIITGNKGFKPRLFPWRNNRCFVVAVWPCPVYSSRIVTKAGMLSLQPHNLSAHEVCRGREVHLTFSSMPGGAARWFAPYDRVLCTVQVAYVTRVVSVRYSNSSSCVPTVPIFKFSRNRNKLGTNLWWVSFRNTVF